MHTLALCTLYIFGVSRFPSTVPKSSGVGSIDRDGISQKAAQASQPEPLGNWKPFVDQVHARGIAFGLHLMHGIPIEAVKRKLPIIGTAPIHGLPRWNVL